MSAPDHSKILQFIATCSDGSQLKEIIKKARAAGAIAVSDAAFKRLIYVLPEEQPGTLEHDFWQTIHAFEHVLSEEREKTTRLARTRQKVSRVGVAQTLRDWAVSTRPTEGFQMLLDRGMPALTGEAIVLRHPSLFEPEIREAARNRLRAAGVDTELLPK